MILVCSTTLSTAGFLSNQVNDIIVDQAAWATAICCQQLANKSAEWYLGMVAASTDICSHGAANVSNSQAFVWYAFALEVQASKNAYQEQRRRLVWARLELGVELGGHIKGVLAELNDLHALPGLVLAHEFEARLLNALDERRIDFVTVAVPLIDVPLSLQCQDPTVTPSGALHWSGFDSNKALPAQSSVNR